jgi:hypothetical protein
MLVETPFEEEEVRVETDLSHLYVLCISQAALRILNLLECSCQDSVTRARQGRVAQRALFRT